MQRHPTSRRTTGAPRGNGTAIAIDAVIKLDGNLPLLLDVHDLAIEYTTGRNHAARIADGISLQIAAREVVGVLGESGSGKSSIALALMGLLPANGRVTRGSIRVDGHEMSEASERAWRTVRGKQIAMVAQEPMGALNPVLRIDTQIAEVLRVHRNGSGPRSTEIIDACLREAGFSDAQRIARSYPHELSGGEAQRVVIAQTLACSPSLLIADEPTASLDPSVQLEILHLLRRVVDSRGMAMLLISHQPAVLAAMADRILVLFGGTIAESGPTRATLDHPAHPHTKALIEAAMSDA